VPLESKPDVQLIQSDARRLPLPDESVQCIVTSPPYWGLRKYAGEQESVWGGFPKIDPGSLQAIPCDHVWANVDAAPPASGFSDKSTLAGFTSAGVKGRVLHESPVTNHQSLCGRCGAWRGAYGLEPTIEMYVSHTVEILREMRRVLRPDGVLFWNIGDSYAANGNTPEKPGLDNKNKSNGALAIGHNREVGNLKPKDLCLIPARVAIAAQADGWWIRSMIIWAKPNPMPESCTDRPTDAYEHILMLTKSERYFWDADAVREPATGNTHSRGYGNGGPKASERGSYEGWADGTREILAARNIRNVWMFPTQPFSGAHFATFPEEIPRRCILAATSARGACTQVIIGDDGKERVCGAPWERVIRRNAYRDGSWFEGIPEDAPRPKMGTGTEFYEGFYPPKTIGWRPTCECRGQHGKTRPCLVLDPFAGSGTTGRVARALRRHAVLADVAYGENDEYRKLAVARLRNVDVELPFL
jgi:DNA modification methylase